MRLLIPLIAGLLFCLCAAPAMAKPNTQQFHDYGDVAAGVSWFYHFASEMKQEIKDVKVQQSADAVLALVDQSQAGQDMLSYAALEASLKADPKNKKLRTRLANWKPKASIGATIEMINGLLPGVATVNNAVASSGGEDEQVHRATETSEALLDAFLKLAKSDDSGQEKARAKLAAILANYQHSDNDSDKDVSKP